MKIQFTFLALLVVGFFSPTSIMAEGASEAPTPFHQTENAMADIDQAIATALAQDKLAVIVLGANWCHDSRALAQHFQSEEMSELMAEKYELLYVDVGFLEVNMNLVSRFGLPVLFGTPTVLVVDPKTETLLNKNTMHKWLSAASVSVDDTKAHFTKLLGVNMVDVGLGVEQSPELRRLLAEISAYESEHTKRINKGYEIVRPLLKDRVSGEGDNETFMEHWVQLSKLRYGLANALVLLREEAIARDASGEENIKLEYPDFPALTWE